MIKGVFDGIISAFHVHDGSQLNEISARLACQLGDEAAQIAEDLTEEKMAFLGNRKLVWLRQRGVQWGPADDHCVAGELIFEPQSGRHPWTLSGEIYELKEKP